MLAMIVSLVLFAQKVEPDAKPDAKTQEKIKKLLTERRDTLKKLVKARLEKYEAGRGTLEVIAESARELLRAELAIATTQAERRVAYGAYLNVAKDAEKSALGRYEAGRGTEEDYLSAKAARLEGEADYLKEGGKEEKDK